MTVHIGQITSEVQGSTSSTASTGAGTPETSEWEDRARLAALLERIDRDRQRTATGFGDD